MAAGLLGLAGLILPWYHPRLSKPFNGVTDLGSTYHAWSGFRILVLAPVLLIVWSLFWLPALLGRRNRPAGRRAADPVRTLGIQSVVAGGIALVAAAVSLPLMKFHYKDWDEVARLVRAQGSTLQKGPQLGLYVVLLGSVLLIAAGLATLFLAKAAPPPSEVAADRMVT